MKLFAILSVAVFAAFVVADPMQANEEKTGEVCPWAPIQVMTWAYKLTEMGQGE